MFSAIRSLLRLLTRRDDAGFVVESKSQATFNGATLVRAWPTGTDPGDFPTPRSLPLPLLTHLENLDATEWVRSLKIFGRNVASFLPGHFPAYARVYHPFELSSRDGLTQPVSAWRDLPEFAGVDIGDWDAVGDVSNGVGDGQTSVGTIPLSIIEVLTEHLGKATSTPEECYFAVWHGFGGLVIPGHHEPRLKLPDREYHVFTGPIAAARTSFDGFPMGHHNTHANLWWPADHAWCVATEIDFAWTYVGGSRECIDAILADPRLEAMETSAGAVW